MSADEHYWLTYAQADLHVAQLLAADASVPGRIACFHAQQAAEKALKAALVATGTPFKKTHDVVVLAGLTTVELFAALNKLDIAVLQPWAVDGRYPGDLPDATARQAQTVVSAATEVVACIEAWMKSDT